jgi:hypothetical protein
LKSREIVDFPSGEVRVLTARLQLLEFLDALPLGACAVRMRVGVIPTFMGRLPDLPTVPGVPNPTPKPSTQEIPLPDRSLAETVEASALTDAAGRAVLSLDVASAVARVSALQRNGQPAVGVYFDESFSAEAYGVELPWSLAMFVELDPNGTREQLLIVDVAKSIVGDTSSTHTTLWFQLHGAPRPSDRYVCELVDVAPPKHGGFASVPIDPSMSTSESTDGSTGGGGPGGFAINPSLRDAELAVDPGSDAGLGLGPLRKRVGFNAARAMTGIVRFTNLRPGALYAYLLKVVPADGAEQVVTQGRFKTFVSDPKRMNIAFGSCHRPSNEEMLDRWKALARRTDQDVLFLVGDQIYGDGIEKIWPKVTEGALTYEDWLQLYVRRYNQLFAYQPMRDALRSRPTYMIFDDHEVVDDWGTDPIAEPGRLEAALEAYNIFQHARNPNAESVPPYDFHYRRGRAAFLFTDSRTGRRFGGDYPVMGAAQHQRLLAWARSEEVRAADLVFVIVPVPPAILPVAQIEEWASAAAPVAGAAAGALAGAIIGGIGGFLVGGPGGAVAGAYAGAQAGAILGGVGASAYYEHQEDNIKDPDVRDAWTYDKNLPDLVRLLDVLFDVANDIDERGRPGPKPKGVFVLSGDYHFGAIHHLLSARKGDRHDHRNNPTMLQVTSSPIGRSPADSAIFERIIEITAEDEFPLDTKKKFYRGRFLGRIMERNFGRIAYEHIGPGRKYRIQAFVEGERDTLMQLYELDLDARPVKMRNLIGEVLAARGRVKLLRVNDIGSGYGPPTDKIDAEVVMELDTQPGRAFGFKLRKDAKLAANKAMLDLLRDAFAHDHPIAIEYKRTGLSNGELIRASLLSP